MKSLALDRRRNIYSFQKGQKKDASVSLGLYCLCEIGLTFLLRYQEMVGDTFIDSAKSLKEGHWSEIFMYSWALQSRLWKGLAVSSLKVVCVGA